MRVESIKEELFAAQDAAKEADDAWQAELDRRGINRYTLAARGETGSTLRECYEAKIASDQKVRELTDTMRRYQDVEQIHRP